MARGGDRQGVEGRQYPNRTDMQFGPRQQPNHVAKAKTYGDRTRQENALEAIPLADNTFSASLTPLDAPTQRPNEPVTAGAPVGAGPGPEVIGLGGDAEVDELRRIYQAFPSESLRQLIEESES